jgi:putative copper export protein
MSAVDTVVIAVRALSFVAAIQAAGVTLFLWLFGDELRSSARPIATAARRAALIGLFATAAYQLLEPARLAGSLSGIVDGPLQAVLLASSVGTATAVRLFGLALTAIGALKLSRSGAAMALIGSALIAGSFAFTGHTATDDQRWLLAPLLLVHILIVAFWFGALRSLLFAGRHEDLAVNARIIERFSKLAVLVVPLILVAGFALAFVLLPSLAALGTPYGQLLIVKVAGFAVLMGLAALNKWQLGPRIGAGSVAALGSLRRCVVVEWWLIAGVLIATAAMTGMFSPDH